VPIDEARSRLRVFHKRRPILIGAGLDAAVVPAGPRQAGVELLPIMHEDTDHIGGFAGSHCLPHRVRDAITAPRVCQHAIARYRGRFQSETRHPISIGSSARERYGSALPPALRMARSQGPLRSRSGKRRVTYEAAWAPPQSAVRQRPANGRVSFDRTGETA